MRINWTGIGNRQDIKKGQNTTQVFRPFAKIDMLRIESSTSEGKPPSTVFITNPLFKLDEIMQIHYTPTEESLGTS